MVFRKCPHFIIGFYISKCSLDFLYQVEDVSGLVKRGERKFSKHRTDNIFYDRQPRTGIRMHSRHYPCPHPPPPMLGPAAKYKRLAEISNNEQEVLGRANLLLSLIRHGPH
jgi:hypothetical protein